MAKRKDKLFLDASVLLAALGSKTGGSFRVLELCRLGLVRTFISEIVLAEVKAHEDRVKKDSAKNVENLIIKGKIVTLPSPKKESIKKFTNFVDDEDRHVVAGAIEAGVDFLLTLDVKHFSKRELRRKVKPLQILTPGEFLQKFVK